MKNPKCKNCGLTEKEHLFKECKLKFEPLEEKREENHMLPLSKDETSNGRKE